MPCTKTPIDELRDAVDLAAALQALVDAIDFEGEDGSMRFNPGGPYEDDRLRAARAALAQASA